MAKRREGGRKEEREREMLGLCWRPEEEEEGRRGGRKKTKKKKKDKKKKHGQEKFGNPFCGFLLGILF